MKYKKNALSKLFMMLGGALAFSAFAQQFEPQSAKTVGTVVDPKGAVYEKLTVISPPLTRLIIYRLPSSTSQNAAGIAITGLSINDSANAGDNYTVRLAEMTRFSSIVSMSMAWM